MLQGMGSTVAPLLKPDCCAESAQPMGSLQSGASRSIMLPWEICIGDADQPSLRWSAADGGQLGAVGGEVVRAGHAYTLCRGRRVKLYPGWMSCILPGCIHCLLEGEECRGTQEEGRLPGILGGVDQAWGPLLAAFAL